MAGQARKKAQKAASTTGAFYWKVILGVNLLYALCLMYHIRQDTPSWQTLQAWTWVQIMLFVSLTLLCYTLGYQGLVSAAASRMSASAYVDLLGITAAAQFSSFVTRYFWVLYLVLPVAGVYLYVLPLLGMLRSMMGGGGGGERETAKKVKGGRSR
jgi:cation transport ATPase